MPYVVKRSGSSKDGDLVNGTQMHPDTPAKGTRDARNGMDSEVDLDSFSRTRNRVLWLALTPAGLFLLAMITPHGRPQDVIAVVTLGIWFIGFPSLLLLGLIAPFCVTGSNPVAKGCLRCTVRAAFFSAAALLVVGDFWVFGVICGLKSQWWKPDLALTATAIALTLLVIPTRRQFDRWTQNDTNDHG